MYSFVGREHELSVLHAAFEQVRAGTDSVQPGRCLLIRGRRRIGKSALAEEFIRREQAPQLYFTAAAASAAAELEQLLHDIAQSSLRDRAVFAEVAPQNWNGALRLLADAVPHDVPSIIVLDEVPYLMESVEAFEGLLQRAWDRHLSRKPVLLLLIGSDLSMMEALSSYDRPFHQRGTEMVVGPLNPAEIAFMLDLEASEAFDATLVTGGLPLICAEWPRGAQLNEYLALALDNPVSALLVSAERSLAAEFPPRALARDVLGAIGSGARTYSNIARAAGGIAHSTLSRASGLLIDKGLVVGELPLSTRPSKERRYRIVDPYLRFWLTFLEPSMALIERRRGDLALQRVQEQWTSWRGRAIEPLVREALARLLPDGQLPAAPAVGAYWTRSNDIEIDIVGADRAPIARQLLFLGSIKWLNASFDDRDLMALHRQRSLVTSEPLPLLAVSRGAVTCAGLTASYGPADLMAAW
jgi:uncharacterized protein